MSPDSGTPPTDVSTSPVEAGEDAGMNDSQLRRLVGINGYMAYSNTLVGNPAPAIREQYLRTTNPVPGDLVLETSTYRHWAWQEDGDPGAALGILLRVVDEPVATQEEHAAMLAEGDYYVGDGETYADVPKERITYLRPLDGSVPEFRWHNADFIRVFSRAERP